jgi:F420-dependent oxidoreductase-like protein
MPMQFGTFVPQGWRMDLVEIDDPIEQYEAMTGVAKTAEVLGYDSIWVYDHFHTVPTPEIETCFEAWTITAALARDTERIKIGQMVTCNGYRNPALLAKIASTVDVLSHGRLLCGLGAGWYEHEWRAYGYGFPELRDRMRAFREAVQIVIKMWTEEKASFQGEYYTLDGAINEPKGVQKPHIPLWLGGGGETVTLKLVA